jgi:nucleoside-diphosphate-sugar epimerase
VGKIAITGSTGFVGKFFLGHLLTLGEGPVVIPRHAVRIVDLIRGCDALVHLAGRAHLKDEANTESDINYRIENIDSTLDLAKVASLAEIKRFIFISSIGVHGNQSIKGHSFSEVDQLKPHNSYAWSKWKAEQGLLKLALETGLEVTIIRSPLVYGFNAPGNFGSLMRAVQKGYPLPLGAVHNQRSLVALDNLVDFIITCISHPNAANQTFVVSDGQDLSTTELLKGMAKAAGVPSRLLPIPVWALQAAASVLGKGEVIQRLCGNLQVDISKARNLLGWVPPISVEEGLRRAMQPTR